ncbi:MAG: hypothetical protein Fur003_5310 [Candidatus Dojkabacteria bacterium]
MPNLHKPNPEIRPPISGSEKVLIRSLFLLIVLLVSYLSYLGVANSELLLRNLIHPNPQYKQEVLGIKTDQLPSKISASVNGLKYSVNSNQLINTQSNEVNYLALINNSPISINDTNPSYIDNEGILHCTSQYDLKVDYSKLKAITDKALNEGNSINFKLTEISTDHDTLLLYRQCSTYFDQKELINRELDPFLKSSKITLAAVYTYKLNSQSLPEWHLNENITFAVALRDYKNSTDLPVNEGNFVIINNQIYLLEDAASGRLLDIEATKAQFKTPLKVISNEKNSFFIYKLVEPEIKNKNLPIIDFTKVIAQGKTQIDLIRDGTQNPSLANAEGGIREINNVVLQPGEEFSYIKAIGRIGNYTKSGYPVGGGTCNSTTTIFRAALEAGFPITERHHHSFLVPSYAWGYKANIVDAAYYPNPRLDLKFKNDLPYPVLLKVDVTRQAGYQYHTVTVRTNRNAPTRTVTIQNFTIFNKYSEKSFSGSFERVIEEKGKATKKETFTSTYR